MYTLEDAGSPEDAGWADGDGRIYKSCALLAVGCDGNVVVLQHFGPAIDWHVDAYSANADELGLEGLCNDLDPGVYIWEGGMGSVKYETLDGTEWDHEVTGEVRDLTLDEWAALSGNTDLWDINNCPKWDKPKVDDGLKL